MSGKYTDRDNVHHFPCPVTDNCHAITGGLAGLSWRGTGVLPWNSGLLWGEEAAAGETLEPVCQEGSLVQRHRLRRSRTE